VAQKKKEASTITKEPERLRKQKEAEEAERLSKKAESDQLATEVLLMCCLAC
jgi:hypothetical protein